MKSLCCHNHKPTCNTHNSFPNLCFTTFSQSFQHENIVWSFHFFLIKCQLMFFEPHAMGQIVAGLLDFFRCFRNFGILYVRHLKIPIIQSIFGNISFSQILGYSHLKILIGQFLPNFFIPKNSILGLLPFFWKYRIFRSFRFSSFQKFPFLACCPSFENIEFFRNFIFSAFDSKKSFVGMLPYPKTLKCNAPTLLSNI